MVHLNFFYCKLKVNCILQHCSLVIIETVLNEILYIKSTRGVLSKLTFIPQPIRDCLSKALNRMLTIFLGTLELTPRSVYPSQIPPVKSVNASATFPPFKAS